MAKVREAEGASKGVDLVLGLFKQILGDKNKVSILKVLSKSSRRFNQLKRETGINPKVLSEQLTYLKKAGLVAARSELYELTSMGRSLANDGLKKVEEFMRSTVEAWIMGEKEG